MIRCVAQTWTCRRPIHDRVTANLRRLFWRD